MRSLLYAHFFFFNDTATTEIYTLSLHDALPISTYGSSWDLSWVDRLTEVPYRVVFDANHVADGSALDLTLMFLDQYHEVYGTRDDQARAVIVMRQLGTPLALGDALWDRYAIGEEIKVQDPATHQPARRNPFL